MPRISNETKELGEKHRKTMESCPIFELWVHRFLTKRERIADFEKAYNYVKGSEDEQEDS